MDHMRISGTEPLAKQSSLKSLKEMSQKYQKKLKPKGLPCKKSTKLQFQ